jgi:hypothetical protein
VVFAKRSLLSGAVGSMSFQFGILSSINPFIATLAFIFTIIFLIFFEFLTGALEYLLEGNHVYNQMLQKIYKELMVMGFVSFVLAMYRAKNEASGLDDLFRVTEFVEYILFFLALFYVAHCLYIMFISVVTSNSYEKVHAQSVLNILERFSNFEKTISAPILSALSYLPLSRTIQEAEFKIIYALFRDTYWLPLNFDYGAYLSGCLATYTHKLINIGVHSWVILISLSLLNLARLELFGNSAFNCHGYQYTDDLHHSPTDDHQPTDDHHRLLSSSTSAQRHVTQHCARQHLNLFFICGALLCLYAVLLYWIAQVYMKRFAFLCLSLPPSSHGLAFLRLAYLDELEC